MCRERKGETTANPEGPGRSVVHQERSRHFIVASQHICSPLRMAVRRRSTLSRTTTARHQEASVCLVGAEIRYMLTQRASRVKFTCLLRGGREGEGMECIGTGSVMAAGPGETSDAVAWRGINHEHEH